MIDLTTENRKYLLLTDSNNRVVDSVGNVCIIEAGLYQYNYTKNYMVYYDRYKVGHIIPKPNQIHNSKIINNNYLVNSVRTVLDSLKLTTDDQVLLLNYIINHIDDNELDEEDLND